MGYMKFVNALLKIGEVVAAVGPPAAIAWAHKDDLVGAASSVLSGVVGVETNDFKGTPTFNPNPLIAYLTPIISISVIRSIVPKALSFLHSLVSDFTSW